LSSHHVFISHSRRDGSSAAGSLYALLRKQGITVLLDEFDFKPNVDLKQSMAEAVDETDLTVCLLSPGYFEHSENTMFELNRSAKKEKCWPALAGMTFDAARTALGSDIHGLAGSLIPTFDPYRPEELAAKIIERLTPSPKVITTTRSTIGSPPEGFLEHIKYVQNIVIPVSAEISGSLEVSPDNDTANTENTGLIIIPTNFGLFDGGDIQIVGSIEVDATVSCPPGSVAQLFSIVNYAGVEHRFALRRIRSGSTYLSNEPLDFVSISLPQVRVTPKKRRLRIPQRTTSPQICK
jgi:TIR domain